MRGKRVPGLLFVAGVVAAASLVECNSLIGLDQMSVGESADGSSTTAPECATNQECTDRFTQEAANAGTEEAEAGAAAGPPTVPGICQKPEGRCVKLTSEDCHLVTGNYLNDDAIVIGSLFTLSGAQASQNQQRQQGATLAIEEINKVGGIPAATAGTSRPLVMVSCDETNLMRAATHLVTDVRVPAIVGPNLSQDTIDLSNNVTVQAGVVVVTPTAVAAEIASLIDNDLTWLMIPSDGQRAPLMIQQINQLEGELTAARSKDTIKFGIVFRDDAMGKGTRTSLEEQNLTINGNSLAAEIVNGNVRIDKYASTQTDFSAIVSGQAAFAPDIIVLAGTAETVTIMTKLEEAWDPANPRPYYLGIDPFKGPQLLDAVKGNDELRRRWRGTGTTPAPGSDAVYNAFVVDYNARYGIQATASGCGAAYDASYAIAYALAATKDLPVTGANIVQGLRKLSSGATTAGATTIETGSRNLLTAFQKLAAGESIRGIGTLCPLAWNANGSVSAGTIEIWCIGMSTGDTPTAVYQSSGLTFDIQTQTTSGSYVQCGP